MHKCYLVKDQDQQIPRFIFLGHFAPLAEYINYCANHISQLKSTNRACPKTAWWVAKGSFHFKETEGENADDELRVVYARKTPAPSGVYKSSASVV